MNNYSLFTDVSSNPGLKVGMGAYLLIPESVVKTPPKQIKTAELEELLVLKKFEDTSSTKLEVQTVLWGLDEYCKGSTISKAGKLNIYTDSQCVAGLLQRRARLEGNDFRSGAGRMLKNASLYAKYYGFHDRLKFDVTKVEGHTRSRSRNSVQQIFSIIDQKVRKALKQWVALLEKQSGEWSLYMIRCRDGELYTGITNDVARRFEEHREMGALTAKYLRGKGPLELAFQKKIGDKSEALKMEQKIKKLTKPEKEIIVQAGF